MTHENISFEACADLFEEMGGFNDKVTTEHHGGVTTHDGTHPEHGRIKLVQSAADGSALLIRC